jgi:hypothetical protein
MKDLKEFSEKKKFYFLLFLYLVEVIKTFMI